MPFLSMVLPRRFTERTRISSAARFSRTFSCRIAAASTVPASGSATRSMASTPSSQRSGSLPRGRWLMIQWFLRGVCGERLLHDAQWVSGVRGRQSLQHRIWQNQAQLHALPSRLRHLRGNKRNQPQPQHLLHHHPGLRTQLLHHPLDHQGPERWVTFRQHKAHQLLRLLP